MNSLPPTRGASSTRLNISNSPNASDIVLSQLVSVKNLINQSLDIVDVSAWTGDPLDARFIFSQLHLLHETIAEAQQMLRGESEDVRGKWEETSADENVRSSLSFSTETLHQFESMLTAITTNRSIGI